MRLLGTSRPSTLKAARHSVDHAGSAQPVSLLHGYRSENLFAEADVTYVRQQRRLEHTAAGDHGARPQYRWGLGPAGSQHLQLGAVFIPTFFDGLGLNLRVLGPADRGDVGHTLGFDVLRLSARVALNLHVLYLSFHARLLVQ
jgi:hypothetical protein